MQKDPPFSLKAVTVFLVLGLLLVTVQVASFRFPALRPFVPDFTLVLVTIVCLTRGTNEAAFVAFVLGFGYDELMGNYIFAFQRMVTACGLLASRRMIYSESPGAKITVSVIVTPLDLLLNFLILTLFVGSAPPFLSVLKSLLPQMAVNALAAWLVLRVLERVYSHPLLGLDARQV